MNLTIQVGGTDDAAHLIQALDKASKDANTQGDDETGQLLSAIANQLRGQVPSTSPGTIVE